MLAGTGSEVLVVDTSAVIEALASRNPDPALAERLAEDGDLHAPHLVDIEVLTALRSLCARGQLSEDRATDARRDFQELALVRYPHDLLAERIWQLRADLTAHDAAFVALAEVLSAPLVTCDRRLAAAPGLGAVVEIYGPGHPTRR